MTSGFSGGCLCGAVRYESSAEPMFAGHCQCTDCRKTSGTGHSSHLAVPRAALRFRARSRPTTSRLTAATLFRARFARRAARLFSR